jgi:acyl carrier protein
MRFFWAGGKAEDKTDRQVLQLLREVLPWQSAKKELRPELSLQSDLGIDSLSKVAFAVRFQETFGVDLSVLAEKFGDVRTVNDVLVAAREVVGQAGGARS